MLNSKKTNIFLIIFLLLAGYSLFASGDDVHNRQMLQVLFGEHSILKKYDERLLYVDGFTGNKQTKILALQKAIYWCVDEFNGDNKFLKGYPRQYLNDLRRFGADAPSYNQINFTANYHHQRYTHKGWDFTDYPTNQGEHHYNMQVIWGKRKALLISTVDSIFEFQETEMIKKESFAALIYYTHILGDHIGDSKKTLPDRMRLNGGIRGRNPDRSDIIWELEYHIPRLFREQSTALEYKALMDYFEKNRVSNPPFIYAQTISDDDYAKLQKLAREILDKLMENIPALLKNERFFTRVFPAN